ncbi:unnamed protein product [Dibothriocephalus latus]|uniref:Uncharacterized protein n=1 Tax=Dibothriocephalus latus TaxID=60516 RepID=A0A3P7L4I4_DIBLA|nr:unnamed protein product [Dibothriocephalus latus]
MKPIHLTGPKKYSLYGVPSKTAEMLEEGEDENIEREDDDFVEEIPLEEKVGHGHHPDPAFTVKVPDFNGEELLMNEKVRIPGICMDKEEDVSGTGPIALLF